MFDVYKIREDFPILDRKVNNTDLVYFDNAATSQTPIQVIDAISDYYKKFNSNIHRGLHSLSADATSQYEESRTKVRKHFGASEANAEAILGASWGIVEAFWVSMLAYVEVCWGILRQLKICD